MRRGVPLWCSRVGSGGAPVVGPGTTALRVRHENENSQNEPGMVSWNQHFHFLVRSTYPVAEARTHRKKRDVCATRGWFWLCERTQPLGTKPKCVVEAIVPP